MLLQRHDPAVQQLVGRGPLAAEIVQQENASVGLEVQRGFVVTPGGIVDQIQVVQGQFAADQNERPPDVHPPLVVPASHFARQFLRRVPMDLAVEDTNDLVLDPDAIRDPEAARQGLMEQPAQGRLAVSRRAIQEQASPGQSGQSGQFRRLFGQHQVREGCGHRLGRSVRQPRQLPVEHRGVRWQRHGDRSHVAGDGHQPLAPFAARLRDAKAIGKRPGAAEHFDQLLNAQLLQQLRRQRQGQPELPRCPLGVELRGNTGQLQRQIQQDLGSIPVSFRLEGVAGSKTPSISATGSLAGSASGAISAANASSCRPGVGGSCLRV